MGANHAKIAARKHVLRRFKQYCDTYGRAPSLRELGEDIGYERPQYVTNVIKRLIADGMILVKPRIVKKADRVSAAGQRWLDEIDE